MTPFSFLFWPCFTAAAIIGIMRHEKQPWLACLALGLLWAITIILVEVVWL